MPIRAVLGPVKTRCHLTVTNEEKWTLTDLAASCPNRELTVTKAVIAYR